MALSEPLKEIPHPPTKPFVGNLFDLDREHPIESLMDLAREYGPIYRITTPGGRGVTVVSGHSLVDELCDESRFEKVPGPGQQGIQQSKLGGGLFTSPNSDPRWSRAHNILLPAFGMDAIRGYHPMMLDVAAQLAQKWERLNPDDEIDVPADMTRLTLDTIALCGFRYRFNSFYRDTPHPFVAAMVRTLERRQAEGQQLPIQRQLDRKGQREGEADQQFMIDTVHRLVDERRASGQTGTVGDLLDRMLTGVDRQTGEQLDDDNIVAQCVTFLVAGHETTSGLLSFALYELLKNPEVLATAYDEVDRVLGSDLGVLPTYAQVRQLAYIDQILHETLRLWPTAPAFSRHPYEDTVLGGGYPIAKDVVCLVLTPMLHRDPAVWGDDPERFDPDRFQPRERGEDPAERLQAVRHRQARLHRPPVRPAGGQPRAGHAPAAIRVHRLRGLPAPYPPDADGQARRLPHQGPDAAWPHGHAWSPCRPRPRSPRPLRHPPPLWRRPWAGTTPRSWSSTGRTSAPRKASPTRSHRTRPDADS